MKRYDSYKDSGVEWVDYIPHYWDFIPFDKVLTEVKLKYGECDNQLNLLSLSGEKGIYIKEYEDEIQKRKKDELENYNVVREGQIVLNPLVNPLRLDYFGFSVSKIEGIVSPVYMVFETPYNSKYLEWYFKSHLTIQYLLSNTKGVRPLSLQLSRDSLKGIKVNLPPLSEQQQIVSFLDTKTSLIDSLIEKTQRKIELLKEKRTSIINEVVTKGLNPNVEMKDSGIEWIGEIPSNWDRLPLKNFGQVTLGKMLTSEDKGGYHLKPYLRSQNIQVEQVNISDVKEMWFSDSELEKLRLEKGDLLFNEGGDVGRTCIWLDEIDECYFQNSVNRVRFENDDERYYLHLSILYHSVGYYDSLVNRVSIPHLTKEKLESVIFLRPPLSEQKQIVEFLDEQTQKIDKTISIEEKRTELLKEYRQSLISEVVTGKRKVIE